MSDGARPFAAIVVGPHDERTDMVDRVLHQLDPTAHAEIEAIRGFAKTYSSQTLTSAVLYSVVEPCPMCAGAIYYAGLKQLVFCVSRLQFEKLISRKRDRPMKAVIEAETILNSSGLTRVTGPICEAQGLRLLEKYSFHRRTREANRGH